HTRQHRGVNLLGKDPLEDEVMERRVTCARGFDRANHELTHIFHRAFALGPAQQQRLIHDLTPVKSSLGAPILRRRDDTAIRRGPGLARFRTRRSSGKRAPAWPHCIAFNADAPAYLAWLPSSSSMRSS